MGKASKRKESNEHAQELATRRVRREQQGKPETLIQEPLLKVPATGWTKELEERASNFSLLQLVAGCLLPIAVHFTGLGGTFERVAVVIGGAASFLAVWEKFAGARRLASVRRQK